MTVLRAEVSPDLRNATVYVSLMGTESEQKLALKGLQHAAGFLQAKVAARLQTRSTPILSFKLDEGVKKSIEISKLIDEALASDRRAHEEKQKRGSDLPAEAAEAGAARDEDEAEDDASDHD